jgi:hypothetical protein
VLTFGSDSPAGQYSQSPDGESELKRAMPYFIEACVKKAAEAYFADLLPYFSKAHIPELRLFVMKCALENNKCFDVLANRFEELPVETMHVLVSVVQRLKSKGTEFAKANRSSSFRSLMLSTTKKIAAKNNAMRTVEKAKKHPKKKNYERIAYHEKQLEAVEATLLARTGTHPILWVLLAMSASVFGVLFFHLLCQMKSYPQLDEPCAQLRGGPIFNAVEQFYVKVEPWAAQVEALGKSALVASKPAWSPVQEWFSTVAWPLIAPQLDAAAPVLAGIADQVVEAWGLFMVLLMSLLERFQASWAEHVAPTLIPVLEQAYDATAATVGPALEHAQTVVVAGYEKLLATIA